MHKDPTSAAAMQDVGLAIAANILRLLTRQPHFVTIRDLPGSGERA